MEVTSGGRSVSVRLVGEIFDTVEESSDHLVLRGAWADLLGLDPGARTDALGGPAGARHVIAHLRDLAQDRDRTDRSTCSRGRRSGVDTELPLFLSVITSMGIVLVVISLGGVFDTVLLESGSGPARWRS